MKNIYSALALSLVPAISFAHPGHDHTHWASAFVHSLVLLSLVAVTAAGIKLVAHQTKKSTKK